MLLAVNAPKAFQRKLVDVVDRVEPSSTPKLISRRGQPCGSCGTRADLMRRGRWHQTGSQ